MQPHLSTLILSSPTALIASCAPLLGFIPTGRCLVALVSAVPGRTAPVTVRVDVPAGGWLRPDAERIATGLANTRGKRVDLVHFMEDAQDEASAPAVAEVLGVDQLIASVADSGLAIGSCVISNGNSWWFAGCSDPTCCPVEGQALDEAEADRVTAEFAYAGCSPLASRQEIGRVIAPDSARADHVAVALGAGPQRSRRGIGWCRRRVDTISQVLLPSSGGSVELRATSPAATAALVITGLDDLRVRDAVVHRLAVAAEDRLVADHCLRSLCDLMRCAPPGRGAPLATLVALQAWLLGRGALANFALDRADADDPQYRLAHLAREMICRGLDPAAWRAGVVGMTEAQCLGLVGRGVPGTRLSEREPSERKLSERGQSEWGLSEWGQSGRTSA